jgi:AbiV family abortive infection protein
MANLPPHVTDDFLAKGAFYALEQAGVLLGDAASLHKKGSYGTALALAELGREEVGRSRILQRLRKELASGRTLTVEEVIEACSDHVVKQEQAQTSVTFQAPSNQALGKALIAKIERRPNTPEYEKATRVIDQAKKSKLKERPLGRHKERMEAIYVDPDASGTGWHRPCSTSKEKARDAIQDFLNDYAGALERMRRTEATLLATLPELPPAENGLLDP